MDHISGEAFDNTRENIRLVTDAENKRNMPKPSNNTTGVCGVTFSSSRKKYIAQVMVNGKGKYLGEYKDIEDAAEARQQANIKYGFHENHGR